MKFRCFVGVQKPPVKRNAQWVPRSLSEVIKQNKIVVYFMEFMEMNNASQCLHFWLTVESYRSLNFLDGKSQNLLDDINSIYMRFFFFLFFFPFIFLFSFLPFFPVLQKNFLLKLPCTDSSLTKI